MRPEAPCYADAASSAMLVLTPEKPVFFSEGCGLFSHKDLNIRTGDYVYFTNDQVLVLVTSMRMGGHLDLVLRMTWVYFGVWVHADVGDIHDIRGYLYSG